MELLCFQRAECPTASWLGHRCSPSGLRGRGGARGCWSSLAHKPGLSGALTFWHFAFVWEPTTGRRIPLPSPTPLLSEGQWCWITFTHLLVSNSRITFIFILTMHVGKFGPPFLSLARIVGFLLCRELYHSKHLLYWEGGNVIASLFLCVGKCLGKSSHNNPLVFWPLVLPWQSREATRFYFHGGEREVIKSILWNLCLGVSAEPSTLCLQKANMFFYQLQQVLKGIKIVKNCQATARTSKIALPRATVFPRIITHLTNVILVAV